MRFRIGLILGGGIGYVVGSKAGRERYDQIMKFAKTVSGNPTVQRTAGKMQAQAAQLGTQARRVMQEKTGSMSHDLADKVSARLPGPLSHMVSDRFGHHTVDLTGETASTNGLADQNQP